MKVLICGSRSFTNPFAVSLALHRRLAELPKDTTIIHGDAPGADRMADQSAKALHLAVDAVPAQWEKHGTRAGIIRNLAMLDKNPALVIAYWDGKSPGTKHTITEAQTRGIPVEVIAA